MTERTLSRTRMPSRLAKERKRLKPAHANIASIDQLSKPYVQALRKAGLDKTVADLMKSWLTEAIEMALATRAPAGKASEMLVATPQSRPGTREDTSATMSAQELGAALGRLSDETVRQREKAGELFSILPPGRKRGRAYPAFQAWPEVAGAPLKEALTALAPGDGTEAYGFFTSVSELLGGLTPLECLIGRLTSARTVEGAALALLTKPAEERRSTVVKAAKTDAAIRAT